MSIVLEMFANYLLFKKYLKIHNWTVPIAMVVTVFTVMYNYFTMFV